MYNEENVILQVVSDHCGAVNLLSPSRRQDLVIGRHLAYKLMRENLRWTLTRIGQYFRKDHTTVLHGIRTINNLLYTRDMLVLEKYEKIISDPRIRDLGVTGDQVMHLYIPMHIDREEVLAHIQTRYPDCELK